MSRIFRAFEQPSFRLSRSIAWRAGALAAILALTPAGEPQAQGYDGSPAPPRTDGLVETIEAALTSRFGTGATVSEEAARRSEPLSASGALAKAAGPAARENVLERRRRHAEQRRVAFTPLGGPRLSQAALAFVGADGAVRGFAAPDLIEPENAPKIFVAEDWPSDPRFALGAPGAVSIPDPTGGSVIDRRPPLSEPEGGATGAVGPVIPGLVIGSLDRPRVLRYACCDDVPVLAEPKPGAVRTATIGIDTQVWVHDLLPSTGLPEAFEALSDCTGGGTPASSSACQSAPTRLATDIATEIFAEVFIPALNRSGFVPLNALHVRSGRDKAHETVFETGYGLIAEALRAGIREALTEPPDCGDPANGITVSASDFGHRDLHYSPADGVRTCDALLGEACSPTLVSCEALPTDSPNFAECIFANASECAGPRPDRDPSQALSACGAPACPIGQGTCGACRAWYEATGQDVSGARTTTEFVDACQAAADLDLCLTPTCSDLCDPVAYGANAAQCGPYIGPADSRSYGDPSDYACGEIPAGATHPGWFKSTDTGKWVGTPDQAWKELASVSLGGETVSVDLGRLSSQTAREITNADLTTGQMAPPVSSAVLGERNFWFAFEPAVSGRDPVFRGCVHLPGFSIDALETNVSSTRWLFALVRSFDLGSARVSRAGFCIEGSAGLDDGGRVAVALTRAFGLYLDIAGITDVEVKPGPGVIGAAITPFLLAEFVQGALVASEFFEFLIDETDTGDDIAAGTLFLYSDKIAGRLLGEIDDAVQDALDGLDFDADDALDGACGRLSPAVPAGHPYAWFYRWMEAQCERLAETGTLRPFRANQASALFGCYVEDAYITPDDAGRARWWAEYAGQEWYFPVGLDQGCRFGSHLRGVMDRAAWPPLRCATAMANWAAHNGTAPHASLSAMIASSCGKTGHDALLDLYGDGQDLRELYESVHGEDPDFTVTPR